MRSPITFNGKLGTHAVKTRKTENGKVTTWQDIHIGGGYHVEVETEWTTMDLDLDSDEDEVKESESALVCFLVFKFRLNMFLKLLSTL